MKFSIRTLLVLGGTVTVMAQGNGNNNNNNNNNGNTGGPPALSDFTGTVSTINTGGATIISVKSVSQSPIQASTVVITAPLSITGGNNVPTAVTSTTPSDKAPPKLTSTFGDTNVIPVYPPPTVPPTANAPYMQKSDVPEGTVFIAVGAVLGAIATIVVAWRMIQSVLLRKSVRQATIGYNDHKPILGGRTQPSRTNTASKIFYNTSTNVAGSSLSLEHLGASSSRGNNGSTLFFSPTAGAQNPGYNSNRDSRYLPAGFYQAAGGNNSSTGAVGSTSRLGMNSNNGGRPLTPNSALSPPSSPMMRPMSTSPVPFGSRSSLALAPKPGERTPSTYLEDLFDQAPTQPIEDGRQQHGGTVTGRSGRRGSGYGAYRQ